MARVNRRRLASVPSLADAEPRSPIHTWNACCAGREPAEALDWRDREDLFVGFWEARWSLEAIAEHTRSTSYTVARVLDRALPHRSRVRREVAA